MDSTTLETLEYPAVLKELSGFAATPPGMIMAEGLRPIADYGLLQMQWSRYGEAADILKVAGRLPVGGTTDISALLAKLGPEGAFLLPEELIQIKNNIIASLQMKALADVQFAGAYPLISGSISLISDQRSIASELERIVDDRAQIKDTASTALYRIRREIRSSKERARSILESISTDKGLSDLLQQDIITIRDDRYVLLIKAGMHTGLGGIVHGRSGSGATYFMEPLELVELNNRVALLKREEKTEEIEVLKAVSARISLEALSLQNDQGIIAEIDCLQAKAIFAAEINGIRPLLEKEGGLRLVNARHPLLIIKQLRGGAHVVPVDVMIPDGIRVVMISGANTGGKTVALKTLGLLSLMVMAAIPVPVDEGSTAVAFTGIFSDIGDRQDIIASLSTFSAHVKRLKEFLALAGPGSLVMMDEIGAGTDPSEGGALALATLETFIARGATCVVTTHLNLLKAHAQVDPAYLNASVEFDEKTLKPLYRLCYGVPGPSLGLSIAGSLGIPSEIVERARRSVDEREGAFIESVRRLEHEKQEVVKLTGRLRLLEGQRQDAVARLREKREAIIEKARAKVDAAVAKARLEIKEVVLRLSEHGDRRGEKKAAAEVDEISKRLVTHVSQRPRVRYVPAKGDKAVIIGTQTRGVVISIDEAAEKAELQMGGLKVWVSWERLEKRGAPEKSATVQDYTVTAEMEVAHTLNLIGMRVEDALPLLKRFIDNAHSNGLGSVEVIHGVGTGRLAKAVRDYLKGCQGVNAFKFADQAQGGAGVTIVELA